MLAGLDRPVGGTLCVDERPLSGLNELELTRLRREHIGLDSQPRSRALPTITVRENVALPLLIARREHDAATIDALLDRVGLSAHRDDRAGELTPAERQRAALARAIAGSPAVLLADEPAGDLDPAEGAALLELLRDIAHEDGVTVLLFTRDAEAAAAVADRVVELIGGRVVEPAAAPLAA